eukprot:TRINITY_DN15378_c0_g1_i1.p1 TRINITY_DN15378_c0_g1~~TRINITY_DN15378_c0_g1_i1.p1  ORF type:complete len:648 (+),score=233.22 TRINITY_DN15378_c0_g1_i1:75-1946(+)
MLGPAAPRGGCSAAPLARRLLRAAAGDGPCRPRGQRRGAALRATPPLRAAVLERFWEREEGAGVAPPYGYHWFPSFQQKAAVKIRDKLKMIDVVLEVRDARLPFSSYNSELEALTSRKPRILVFNKADLADLECNKQVKQYYKELGVPVLFTDCSRKEDPVRVLVVGMPNVGKSSLIKSVRKAFVDEISNPLGGFRKLNDNRRLAARRLKSIGINAYPGLSRKLAHVPIPGRDGQGKVLFIDSPGFMQPAALNPIQGLKLGVCGLTDFARLAGEEMLDKFGHFVWRVCWEHGMEANVMTHFRMEYPIPRTYEEFRVRALLSLDLLGTSQKRTVATETDSSAFGNKNSGNIVLPAMTLISAFRKGALGRITLDEIPTIDNDWLGKAPRYLRDLLDQERERREERRVLLELRRAKREQSGIPGGEEPEQQLEQEEDEEPEPGEVQPPRLWDVKSTTLTVTAQTPVDFRVEELARRLHTDDAVISRKQGPLTEPVDVLDRGLDWERRQRRLQQVEQQRAERDERYNRLTPRKRQPWNYDLPDIPKAPRPENRTKINRFQDPNPLNNTTAINLLTGQLKPTKAAKREVFEGMSEQQFWRGFTAKVKVDPATGRAVAGEAFEPELRMH